MSATPAPTEQERMTAVFDMLTTHRQFGSECTGCDWLSDDIGKSLKEDHAGHVNTLIAAAVARDRTPADDLAARVEAVLAEWTDTMRDDPKSAAVVRGMSLELRGLLAD